MAEVTAASPSEGKVVEGSEGLLVEVDGQVLPNYDATLSPFEEGVVPSNELSIRKSVDPADEVELGEEVDALVLTKEDQDGRLILSKKRARFERAWKKIEAAAE